MRRHVSNGVYGLLDYVAYPAIMLVAAPTMMGHLGTTAYGIWLIANAAIGAGSILSSGFGDAVIQRVAALRSTGDQNRIRAVLATVLGINLAFSLVLTAVFLLFIPLVSARIAHNDPALRMSCAWSLRIGSALIVLKSIESVFISAQRAFENYAPAVSVSVFTRISIIVASIILASRGNGVPVLMVAAFIVAVGGAIAQWCLLKKLGFAKVLPTFDRVVFRQIASFGTFSWLQAMSGVFFSQADRLLLAVTMGASAVSYYGICVQIAQPIHGLTAAGLHFIFPVLSLRYASGDPTLLRRPVLLALALNVACALVLTAAVFFCGGMLLNHWMGRSFAAETSGVLPWLALGFGMLSLNVTGHYALLALGHVRVVTVLNVVGGISMLLAMLVLVPMHGVKGAAVARLFFGSITCLLYLPLFRILYSRPFESQCISSIVAEKA